MRSKQQIVSACALRRVCGILLAALTAVLLIFYFLQVREYHNRDVTYVLLAVITSGAATLCMPAVLKKEWVCTLWLFLFCEFFLRATVYGRADFFEYTLLEADVRRTEWFISEKVNLVPFHTIKLFWGILAESKDAFFNLAGNVVLLTPCSFLVPLAVPKVKRAFRGSGFWIPFLLGAALSALAEALQLFFMCGAPDIDDLILNTFGAAIGALAAYLLFCRGRKTDK